MKVYVIEVVEVQHVRCHYFVEASSEAKAKEMAAIGCAVNIDELEFEQVTEWIVGDIISSQDIDDTTRT